MHKPKPSSTAAANQASRLWLHSHRLLLSCIPGCVTRQLHAVHPTSRV